MVLLDDLLVLVDVLLHLTVTVEKVCRESAHRMGSSLEEELLTVHFIVGLLQVITTFTETFDVFEQLTDRIGHLQFYARHRNETVAIKGENLIFFLFGKRKITSLVCIVYVQAKKTRSMSMLRPFDRLQVNAFLNHLPQRTRNRAEINAEEYISTIGRRTSSRAVV